MVRGSLRLEHQKACPVEEGHRADAAAAKACRCSPRVRARLARRDYTLGSLGKGWKTADLEPFERKLVDVREAIVEGRSPRPRRVVTLGEYAPGWFTNLHAAVRMESVSPLTYNTYEGQWRLHIGPFFARYALGAIDVPLVNRYIAQKLEQGMARNTVMATLTPLSAMLTDAAAESPPLIAANPLRSPRRGRHANRRLGIQLEVERRPPKHLEIDEALVLLAATPDEYLDMVLCPLATGFRRAEIFGLEWPELLWGRDLVELNGQLRGRQKVRCKYKSERVVPLWSAFATVLGPRRQAEGYVFSGPEDGDRVWSDRRASEILDEAYVKAGLKDPPREKGDDRPRRGEGLGWHALRHTYNSVLAAAGVPRHVREELMGHKRRAITDRYEHVLSGAYEQVEQALEQAFGAAVRQRGPTTSERIGGPRAAPDCAPPMGIQVSPSVPEAGRFRL